MKKLPIELQEEIMDMLENKGIETFVKYSKIKQARLIVKLRQKYYFKNKSLGMN